MSCSDPDLVTYSVYEDMASDEYFYNEKLLEIAQERHDDYCGFRLGQSFVHLSSLALDYLFEAKLTYCFGFYRSSIFCCITMIDFELKRALVKLNPSEAEIIEKQTFGQSIIYLKDKKRPTEFHNIIDKLEWLNTIRNKVAVHCGRKEFLISSFEDEPKPVDTSPLKIYLNDDEIKEVENENKGKEINWLRFLELKIILEIREIISYGICSY